LAHGRLLHAMAAVAAAGDHVGVLRGAVMPMRRLRLVAALLVAHDTASSGGPRRRACCDRTAAASAAPWPTQGASRYPSLVHPASRPRSRPRLALPRRARLALPRPASPRSPRVDLLHF